ncbi:MAG: hypothetical protein IJC43_02300 [Clostridia bacterium]|nr:hypothetical protein [Clostridia bacterium]
MNNPYAYGNEVGRFYPAGRAGLAPVPPVDGVDAVSRGAAKAPVVSAGIRPAEPQLPEVRQGADPVEMAVRGRIRYLSEDEVAGLARAAVAAPQTDGETAGGEAVEGSKSAAEVMEEAECQTCAERRYQDGSDDPGVSFKTPAHIDPSVAASVVRGHEQEHVSREQAKADREGREVVSQSVTLHSDICPECGKVYVSGGTTRTTTRAENDPQQEQQRQAEQEKQKGGFAAVA